jgi:hypothetical protein
MGIGHAMALTYNNDGEDKKIIFISKIIALAIIDDNAFSALTEDVKDQCADARQSAINYIHHELLHVHEFSMIKSAFKNDNTSKITDILTKDFRALAQVVWSEYYACRLSCKTCNNFTSEIDNLIDQANLVKERMDDEINKYRYHADINKLIKELSERLKTLLNYAAYLHGKLFALDDNFRLECINKIDDLLKETILYETWVTMGDDFDNLFSTFPNWQDRSIFDKLGNTIKIIINKLGFFPEVTSEGVYYSVPFNI